MIFCTTKDTFPNHMKIFEPAFTLSCEQTEELYALKTWHPTQSATDIFLVLLSDRITKHMELFCTDVRLNIGGSCILPLFWKLNLTNITICQDKQICPLRFPFYLNCSKNAPFLPFRLHSAFKLQANSLTCRYYVGKVLCVDTEKKAQLPIGVVKKCSLKDWT